MALDVKNIDEDGAVKDGESQVKTFRVGFITNLPEIAVPLDGVRAADNLPDVIGALPGASNYSLYIEEVFDNDGDGDEGWEGGNNLAGFI